jgi:hypothetical protein
MPCPQFGLDDHLGEATVHELALGRRSVGVHATCQQGMGEADPVAFDGDDAVPLGGLEELDQSAVVGRGRLADQLHGRRGQAGGGE